MSDLATGDDHQLARRLAALTGERLLAVRAEGLSGSALKAAGDAAAQAILSAELTRHRPEDVVLSEEAPDPRARLVARRVWIIDPLDGTREFAENGREDWAVHVALWQEGQLVAGAVAVPAAGLVFDTAEPPTVPARSDGPLRLAVSRTRPPGFTDELAAHLGAVLVPMGSAGVKCASVWRGQADAYVHAGGQFEWDNAAPVAVARASGLFTSRIDGSALVYNQPDPSLPDLVVCRPEIADQILSWMANYRSAKPAPAKPAPAQPEPAQPEPAQLEPAQQDPAQQDPAQYEGDLTR
jgi:3'(2'), 5'-bisphosphate nucleotidase